MADRIQLNVITPERSVLSEAVDAVTVPGANGEIGILPGHTPLISQIDSGVLGYTQGATTTRLLVSGGFVEVTDERVNVLVDLAQRPDEIDAAAARQTREQAEKTLGNFSGTDADFAAAQADLERANARLQLAADGAGTTFTRA